MDAGLKQRLIGAAVLVALAVIFLPMLVKGPAPDSGVSDLSMRVPDAPESGYRTVDLPLVVPADTPEGGVLGTPEPLDDGQLATVDTATAPPPSERPAADAPAGEDAAPVNPDAADLAQDAPAPAAPTTPAVPTEAPTRPEAATARTQAAAAPLPPATAGGDYVVHFGAFGSERDAQLIVRQLSQAGLTAYSEPFTLNGRAAQRVRLGPFASREAAEATRVRAAQVRSDVTPRVVALDAAPSRPASES
ncbi:SPOR domain-containing protein, partial [Luteimonas sp. SDU101]|uniref:SPOR domain-containing protein n=1 Tax=Luteimonas sp. SDU101 TaxID=3422593 RepID=UPI003EBF070B